MMFFPSMLLPVRFVLGLVLAGFLAAVHAVDEDENTGNQYRGAQVRKPGGSFLVVLSVVV
jgi:hypothetical protein